MNKEKAKNIVEKSNFHLPNQSSQTINSKWRKIHQVIQITQHKKSIKKSPFDKIYEKKIENDSSSLSSAQKDIFFDPWNHF